jgi:meiotic recombination protein SPO11
LHTGFPHLPVIGLVDWNPAGVSILVTYKLGNRRMGLEAAEYAVPRLAWLGVLAAMLQVGHAYMRAAACDARSSPGLSLLLW